MLYSFCDRSDPRAFTFFLHKCRVHGSTSPQFRGAEGLGANKGGPAQPRDPAWVAGPGPLEAEARAEGCEHTGKEGELSKEIWEG